jgi:hypothetical protein
MSNPSNLYAEKVFSEHPISLWALDDDLGYISFASPSHSDYSSWTPSTAGITQILQDAPQKNPVSSYDTYKISAPYSDPSVTPYLAYTIFGGQDPILYSQMDSAKETFSIGVHSYVDSLYYDTLSIAVGYVAYNPATMEGFERTKSFQLPTPGAWNFLSETFLLSELDPGYAVYPYVKVLIQQPSVSLARPTETIPTSYDLYLASSVIGQFAENFGFTEGGQTPVALPRDIAGVNASQMCIPAKEYGISGQDAYYLTNGYSLLAQNFGVPMVYGASNVTRIKPMLDSPSLVIPGHGALNSRGRHEDYTIEAWIRVDHSSALPRRILGPVASEDGIYLDGPFVKLRIGATTASHFLGDWFRPMLMDLRISAETASLLVNGEEVISISISTSLEYPDILSATGQEQDWIGIYAYADVPLIEMDCFAIYSYLVPSIVAKRRFAYGQAVEFPENVNSAYSGTSTYIDYNFADYTNNYAYPDIGQWYQGTSDNANLENGTLSSPNYSLPAAILESGSTYDEWISSNLTEQVEDSDLFVTFKNDPGYLYFKELRILKQDTRAFYVVFDVESAPQEKQVLVRVDDNINGNYFEISLEGGGIKYSLNYNGEVSVLYEQSDLIANTKAFAGVDIDGLAQYFGREISAFFGNKSRLSVYVGSDKDLVNPFAGRIFSVNFCTERNFYEIAGLFVDPEIASTEFVADSGDSYFGAQSLFWYRTFDGGLVDSFSLEAADSFVASYSLRPKEYFGTFMLDILTSSYWEDYLPLKYFAQYVDGSIAGGYYDLDFIQFNLAYPNRHIENGSFYDTSNEQVKTYITFQYTQSGSNAPSSYFTSTEKAPTNNVITPGSDWITTKYEVLDGTIIYMPSGINFGEVSIVTHIEIITDGTVSSPVSIRKLEYASQAYNSETSNPIGTRFGVPVYPYKRYGLYYDYKTKNPYRITKKQNPYLYLTSSSGIQKVGDDDPSIDRGLSIPMNQRLAEKYRVVSIQMAMRYPGDSFPDAQTRLMEIESKSSTVRIYCKKNDESGNRAKIYAVNAKTGQEITSIEFYINGNRVANPVISLHEWNVIGMKFSNILDLDGYVGSIRINGPILVNNLSFYQSTNLQERQRQEFNNWYDIVNVDDIEPYWSSVITKLPFWNNVLVKSTINTYGISPDEIYRAYIGTNKVIVDDLDGFMLQDYEYSIYSDIKDTKTTYTPV